MKIEPGLSFRSTAFDGTTTVVRVDRESNDLYVAIYYDHDWDPRQPPHHERWNLEHTIQGFRNFTYTRIKDLPRTVTLKATEATQAAARDAIACQDACNTMGVLSAFDRHMKAMTEADRSTLDTDTRNQHPVVLMFLDKFAHLGRYKQDTDRASDAWIACEKLAKGEDVEWEIHPL